MDTPRVLVSILNWKQAERTLQCIASVKSINYPALKIVVVDNASQDGSIELIKNTYPDITVVASEKNLGYAGGNELALELALADDEVEFFWILNNDAKALADTLSQLLVAYQKYGLALYGGVPVHESAEGYRLHMRVWENNKFRMIRDLPFDSYFKSSEAHSVEAISGSHMFFPLELVRKYGYMDVSYFLYSEDTDYCFRLRRAGIKVIEVPQSIVIHAGGESHKSRHLSKSKPIIHYYRSRNRIILFRRYFGFLPTLGEIIRQAFLSLAWILASPIRGLVAGRIGYYMLLGIADGIANRMGKIHAPEEAVRLEGLG